LASTIFPMGNIGTASTYQTEAASTGLSGHVNKSMGLHDHIAKPNFQQHSVQTNAQKFSYTTATTSKPNQLTGSIPQIQKSYGRLGSSALRPTGNMVCAMSTSQQHELGLSSDTSSVHDHPIQSFKRMKLISTSSLTPSISSTVNSHSGGSFMTSFENKRTTSVPDTVLMVTNEGETVLSTSHGGVTLMTPNSMSLPVTFSIKDDHGMSVPSSHAQFSQPVTILSSCTSDSQGLEEVVYSITEVPGGGHEVLMSGPITSLNDQSPIIVYDPGDDGSDKKLFADSLHKE